MSFALVAGAICSIKFSNTFNTSRTECTLNINSTGAKSVDVINAQVAMAVYGREYSSPTTVVGPGLTVYNGSTYRFVLTQPYNDYSD